MENLLDLAQDDSVSLDLTQTIVDFGRVVLRDRTLRSQLIAAVTADNTLQVEEILKLARKFDGSTGQILDVRRLVDELRAELPALAAYFALDLSQSVVSPVPALRFLPRPPTF